MRRCGSIAGKWKPLILYFLAQGGPTRYGELRRAVRDVSDKMLIQQLKELEADGLVRRTDYKENPHRWTMASPSPVGPPASAEALVPLCSWGTENMAEVTRVFAQRAAPEQQRTVRCPNLLPSQHCSS